MLLLLPLLLILMLLLNASVVAFDDVFIAVVDTIAIEKHNGTAHF
jgi:hypothetical protein